MDCKNCEYKIQCFIQRVLCEYGLIFSTVLSYPIRPCEFSVFRKSDCENSCLLLTKANFERICQYGLGSESKAVSNMIEFCKDSSVCGKFIKGTKSSKKNVYLCNNRDDLESICKCTEKSSSVNVDTEYSRKLCIIRFLLTAIVYLGECDELNNIFALMGLDNGNHSNIEEFKNLLEKENFQCIGNNIGPIANSMTDIFRIFCDYCKNTDLGMHVSNLQQTIECHLRECNESVQAWA